MAKTIRVVIAEDHTLVRQGTRQLLQQESDIDVVGEAADGEEALTVIGATRPDVALVDISMPRLDGVTLCRRIRERYPETAVIALTVHDEEEYVTALLEAGASGYLLKDVDTDELVHSIRTVHDGGTVLDPKFLRAVLQRMRTRETPADEPRPTPREVEVLKLVASGLSNRDVAERLGISAWTVQTHIAHLFAKLGASSRTRAVIQGLHAGWISLDELE